jgi:Tol biopolymer transport system component
MNAASQRQLPRSMSRARLAAAAVLAAALLATGMASAPEHALARTPGVNGQLAFDRDGGSALFTINADGTNEQKLFDSQCCPGWSPDGNKIVTPAMTDDGRFSSATFDPDGSNFIVLPIDDPALTMGCEAWSPDGSRLLCTGAWLDERAPIGVFTRRASDGGDLRRVTTNPYGSFDQPGDFSPDGSRIAFIRYNPGKQAERAVFVVNADGTSVRRITPWGMAGCCTASWSPDGRWILFDARGHLYKVHPDGTGLREIPLGMGGRYWAYEPVWSPDGMKIAFSAWVRALGQDDIYTADADGSNVYQVTNTPEQEGQVDWGTHQP